MLNKIKELVQIASTSYNNFALQEAINVCKKYYQNQYTKEIVYNNVSSILFANCDSLQFDVLSVCHIDVVNADNSLFNLKMGGGKIFGRGIFDMKSFIVSSLENLQKINHIKYGVLISTDEEIGGENCTKYWNEQFGLKANIILDCDDGYNINAIINEKYGSCAIKLLDNAENNKSFFNSVKDKLQDCELINNDEINFYFQNAFNKKLFKNIPYEILLLNEYYRISPNNQYLKLYKNIVEQNTQGAAKFDCSRHVNDSRFFYNSANVIITHQATGGDNHKNTEWLDLESLYLFNKIQLEFLSKIK